MSHYYLSGTGSSRAPRTAAVHAWIRDIIRERLQEHGDLLMVVSGGAMGWDAALAYCATMEGVPYKLVLPSKDYGSFYWKESPGSFRRMVNLAASVEYVCASHIGSNGRPGGANFDRNKAMVDMAHEFLVYDVGSPGTRHAVSLIRLAGKPMIEFPVSACWD